MANLLAYVPVPNKRHVEWVVKHGPRSNLFLIPQEMAEELIPRLARNKEIALPAELVRRMLQPLRITRGTVAEFAPEWEAPNLKAAGGAWRNWIMPDEDISRAVTEEYLLPAHCTVEFEKIWARYDMAAVLASQPVVADVEVSSDRFHLEIMEKLSMQAKESPDWWRQVAAAAVSAKGQVIATAFNTHLPTEYECYILGDPAINRDAGQAGKSCSLHAEEAVITLCARHGYKLDGGRIYATIFPCERCARQIANAGVKQVFFRDGFSSLNAQGIFRAWGVKIIRVV